MCKFRFLQSNTDLLFNMLVHFDIFKCLSNSIGLLSQFGIKPKNLYFFLCWTDDKESNKSLDQTHARNDDNFNHFSSFKHRKGSIDIVQPIDLKIMKF